MTTTEHRLISPHGTPGPWKSQEDLAVELIACKGRIFSDSVLWQVETRTITITETTERASTWLVSALPPVK